MKNKMARRKEKIKKEFIIDFNFNDSQDIYSMNDFFNNDFFFNDFDEIFQRMNNLMENIFRQNFDSDYNNHDNYSNHNNQINQPQIFIEPQEETEENIEQNIVEPDYEREQETETDARIFYVNPEKLPHSLYWRALGIYVPYLHSIFIANNLPPKIEKFVYYHEIAHSKGIMDEEEADKYATKKCGYYVDLGRRPRNRYCRFYY